MEAGVLERDRGQLRELLERVDLGLPEDPLAGPDDRPMTPDRHAADGQRHPDDRPDPPDEPGMARPRTCRSRRRRSPCRVREHPARRRPGSPASGSRRRRRCRRCRREPSRACRRARRGRRSRWERRAGGPLGSRIESSRASVSLPSRRPMRHLVERRHELVARARGTGRPWPRTAPGPRSRRGSPCRSRPRDGRRRRCSSRRAGAAVVGDRLDGRTDPARHLLGRLAPAVGQDHRELVAAVAVGPVALPDAAPRSPGSRRPGARRRPGGRSGRCSP